MTTTNIATVNRIPEAVFGQDHDALAKIFTDDFVFHFRGPHPANGDHRGIGGLLEVIGGLAEATEGDIKLDQVYCVEAGDWVSEFEHATLGRNGKTLVSDNALNFRFENGRVAEMWMYLGVKPADAEAFFA